MCIVLKSYKAKKNKKKQVSFFGLYKRYSEVVLLLLESFSELLLGSVAATEEELTMTYSINQNCLHS